MGRDKKKIKGREEGGKIVILSTSTYTQTLNHKTRKKTVVVVAETTY